MLIKCDTGSILWCSLFKTDNAIPFFILKETKDEMNQLEGSFPEQNTIIKPNKQLSWDNGGLLLLEGLYFALQFTH